MISADTNIFLHAALPDADYNRQAVRFLEQHSRNRSFVISAYMLSELYVNMRRPILADPPKTAEEAATHCKVLMRNPHWRYCDVAAGQIDDLFEIAGQKGFAYRRIYDARMALSLRRIGVTEFATTNVKDFEGFGFTKVWNPLEE